MKVFLDFVNGDSFTLMVLIAILWFVGSMMVKENSNLSTWGFRCGVAGYLTFVLCSLVKVRTIDANEFVRIAFRGLFAAGLVLALSWICLAVLAFFYRNTIARLLTITRALSNSWRDAARRRRERRATKKHRSQEQQNWERSTPERERLRRGQEELARQQADAQRRREDARAQAELLFSLHAHRIKKLFTRAMLQDFIGKYMGDTHDAEYVENRSRQLQATIDKVLVAVQPEFASQSLDELNTWYETARQRIAASPLDENIKEAHLAELQEQYSEQLSVLLRGPKP